MQTFIDLLNTSVLIRGFIAILAMSATMYLQINGRSIPSELWVIDGIVLTSLYGAAGNVQLARAVTLLTKTIDTATFQGGSRPDGTS